MKWWTDSLLDDLLNEDTPYGDLTTEALGISAAPARLTMAMREDSTVCGVELAADLFRKAGATALIAAETGARVPARGLILTAEGAAGAILTAWKVAQTLVEYLSGIATATAEIVGAARAVNPAVAVVTTRKTFPGTKRMMIAAIKAGGAMPHRLGLSETLLVFPEHRVFLADGAEGISRLREAMPEKKVVVEVATLEEARDALSGRPDILQCEKMTPEGIRAVCDLVKDQAAGALVAAAGGVNARNAADYATAGARILVTSAPYWARPSDVKVTIAAA